MPFFSKRTETEAQNATMVDNVTPGNAELPTQSRVTFMACFLGLVASIGGFMFGYVSGQISGKNTWVFWMSCRILTIPQVSSPWKTTLVASAS